MQSVKVSKADLVTKIQANRDNHSKLAQEVYEIYVQDVIAWLKEKLKVVKDTGKASSENMYFNLIEPQNHTSEYDVVLAMLEMSTEKEVTLTHHEFNRYVMDNWEWKQMFTASNSAYLSKKG